MSSTLRSWLARAPHPSTIRAELADGNERTVRVGATRSKWRDAEAALRGCVRAEALDDTGATLRVWEAEGYEPDAAGGKSAPRDVQSELVQLAELYSAHADRAVERHAAFVGMAFEQMASLVGVLSGRLAALEKAWHQLLMSQDNSSPDADPNQALVGQVLMGALMGGGQPPAPPQPPNGKKG